MAVYKVLDENEFFDIEDLSEGTIKFSLLTTALGYESISAFVGAVKPTGKASERRFSPTNPIVNPEALSTVRVKELAEWLFAGTETGDTRIGESRHLSQLAKVVENKEALASFRRGASLKTAYRETSGIDDELANYLTQCKSLSPRGDRYCRKHESNYCNSGSVTRCFPACARCKQYCQGCAGVHGR